ncbi:unnamed protein product [Triticum turgidum subsp. durum]|uniref:HD domain-containing protein n=1 Tax=Triticum turgidum subsp. durum TaxID=4567 RepID=A0A9R0RKL3_TRITD|nr:unnamed protein product [Triticum turgidum subsp. durum]
MLPPLRVGQARLLQVATRLVRAAALLHELRSIPKVGQGTADGVGRKNNNWPTDMCIKIAIVHDIAEAIVGDITPSDGIPKAEKSRREQEALNEMCEVLGGGSTAEEIKGLWEEYENNSSVEANLVKDFDKVEMILQALEYEKEHGKVLDEFFLSTAGKFQTEIGKSWAAEVNSRRTNGCGQN